MAEKKTGRPSKLTPEVIEKFLSAIESGAPYTLACNYAGIVYQTFLNWRQRTDVEFVEFFEAIREAEGKAAIDWLRVLDKHSDADARWAAWKLERRYPQDFGRRDRLPVDVSELDRQFEAAMGELESAREADISASPQSEAIN